MFTQVLIITIFLIFNYFSFFLEMVYPNSLIEDEDSLKMTNTTNPT